MIFFFVSLKTNGVYQLDTKCKLRETQCFLCLNGKKSKFSEETLEIIPNIFLSKPASRKLLIFSEM